MVHPAAAASPRGTLIMAIDRIGTRAGLQSPAEPAAPQHDSGFANLLPAETSQAQTSEAASPAPLPPPSASGVAWLQAGITQALARETQDKEARRHGRAMLQALGAVQLAVLGGDDRRARSALASLASTAEDEHQADDPVLRLILREIGVRAAVELARADQTGDVSIG